MLKTPKEVVQCFADNMPSKSCAGGDNQGCVYVDVCCEIADSLDIISADQYRKVDNDSA